MYEAEEAVCRNYESAEEAEQDVRARLCSQS